MSGAEPRASCTGLFKKPEILPVPYQYILSLIKLIIENSNNFQTGLEIHGLHTRCKNHLFIPVANITRVKKKIITYSSIKIYNSLPNSTSTHRNDRKKLRNELYRYLVNNSFYSVEEVLEFSRDN
jgi:hypothetical protein